MPKRRTSSVYPLSAIRAVALHAQGLARAENQPTTAESMYQMIEQMGCVQIDTLHLVHRSQYIAMWSRLGSYDPALFDQVAYGTAPQHADRKLFEYWLKAACYIPLTEYRYRMPLMRYHREGNPWWFGDWSKDPGNKALIDAIFQRIRDEGGLRSADFEHPDVRRGTWWDWKPAKRALEHLYNGGRLMIANRVKFQRVYDLPERVLPTWVDTKEATTDEMHEHYIQGGLRRLGVCVPLQAADYFRMKRTPARPIIAKLVKSGEFVEVQGEIADGDGVKTTTLMIHRDDRALLDQAADGELKAERTTFLSPFDNLFWATGRDQQFWSFRQHLEAYTPEPKRVYGYFCLPILQRGRLVGRFDPKLHRKTGVLELKALYLEPGFKPDEELVNDVAGALRDFMHFHKAKSLEIVKSTPADFGKKLLRALK